MIHATRAADGGARVLLLDEGFMGSAYTAVGLRNAGCRVAVLAGTGGRGGHDGRGIRWSLAPPVQSAAFLAAVDDALAREHFDYVYPTTEPIQQRVWDAGPAWASVVYPPTLAWQRDLLRDKRVLGDYVADRGVLIPARRPVAGDGDVRAAVADVGLPIVVKGVRGRGGSATHVTASLPAAIEAARRVLRHGTACFVEEFVRGATFLAGGLFHEGRALRIYLGEKLEQHPPATGPAIRIRSVADAALLESALAVFRELRWSGLASADFVRGPDGRFFFLEVNPRPWGSIPAADAAGVDLFTPFAELLGGVVPASDLTFRPGVECTVFPLYLLSRGHWRRGRALASLARDLRGPQGLLWRSPGQAGHLVHRLYRVVRNWG
jgi:hypothetical protein